MSMVFVLDQNKHPQRPIHPGWARKLLSSGKATVFRSYPFTIHLKEVVESPVVQPLRVKLDPGSKTTGFQTGDIVRAVVTSGVKVGTYVGKVAVRATGSFNITMKDRTVQGVSHRFCTVVHHGDGYSYSF